MLEFSISPITKTFNFYLRQFQIRTGRTNIINEARCGILEMSFRVILLFD